MAGELDDLIVVVGGDISPLQDALAGIPAAMAGVSNASADAFAGLDATLKSAATASTQAGNALNTMGAQAQKAASDSAAVDDAIKKLGDSAQNASQAAKSAADGWNSLTPAIKGAGDAAEQTSLSFGSIGKIATAFTGVQLGIEALITGIKDLAEAAVGTFSMIERSTLALTALTGSAEVANDQIDRLKSLAVSEALSFPELVSANQRMIAMGFSTSATNAALQAAANASAATGVNLVMVTNSLERMSEAGMLAGRQLATLGLSLQDVAKVEGTTAANAAAMFRELDPAGRLDVLIAALNKYHGTAAALVVSLSGQFKQLSNEILFALEPIGAAIAPMLKSIMTEVQTSALPAIEQLVKASKDLGNALGPVLTTVITGTVSALSDLAAVTAGAASSGLKALDDAMQGLGIGFHLVDAETGKANITLADFARVSSAIISLGTTEYIHAGAVEFELMGKDVDLATEALKRHNQIQHDVIQGIKDLIDNAKYLSTNLQNIADAFQQQKAALQEALIVLNNTITAYKDGNASLGQVKAAQDAYNAALYAMDPAAKVAADAAKKVADSIQSIVDKSNLTLKLIPTTLAEAAKAFEDTGATVKSSLSKVDSELQTLKAKMVEIGGATTDMLKTWGELETARTNLRQLAAEQAWTQIKDKIDALGVAMNQATGPTRDQLTEMAKLQKELQNAADAAQKVGVSVTQLVRDTSGAWHVIFGPVPEAAKTIEVLGANLQGTAAQANAAKLGIELLAGSTNDLTTAASKASGAETTLGTVFRTTAEQAKIAAEAAEGQAKALQNVAEAAEKAATGMSAALDASNKLSQSFKVTGFGGGPGGSESPGGTIGTKPGDVITQRGEAGQIISQNAVPGGVQAFIDWYNSLFVAIPQIHKLTDATSSASTSIANLSTAATQSASSLISAATSIASSLGGPSSLSVAQTAYQTAVDAYNKIAAFYQSGQATADQMRAAQDAVNAALAEMQKLTGPSGAFVLLSGATGDLATATGDLTGVTSGLGIATNGLANTATTAAATIATAATSISDATAAAVNGINSVIEVVTPTIQAAAAVASGINTLMAAVVPAVQAAAAVVMGVNSTTLLPSTGSTALPSVTPSGPGGYNTTTMLRSGQGLQGPGTAMTLNVNVTGGGGAAIGREIINTVQSMGLKF